MHLNDRFGQAGDTIVEVVISMAIIAVVLAGGYSASAESLNSERRAGDRSTALQLLQGQIELTKYYVQNLGTIGVGANAFCMYYNPGNSTVSYYSFVAPNFNSYNPSNYDIHCNQNSAAQPAGGVVPYFSIAVIKQTHSSGSLNSINYTAYAYWYPVGRSSTPDTANLTYNENN